MYIPKINRMDDVEEIIAFMQRYSFATVATAKDDRPVATHLPAENTSPGNVADTIVEAWPKAQKKHCNGLRERPM